MATAVGAVGGMAVGVAFAASGAMGPAVLAAQGSVFSPVVAFVAEVAESAVAAGAVFGLLAEGVAAVVAATRSIALGVVA